MGLDMSPKSNFLYLDSILEFKKRKTMPTNLALPTAIIKCEH